MKSDLYKTRESRLDTVAGENAYWAQLGKIAKEWMAVNTDRWGHGGRADQVSFNDWLECTYGFRAVYDEDGGITAEPQIVNDQKYLLFLLKHGL